MASSERGCCVPICGKTRKDNNTVLHSFPNPDKEMDRYLSWIQAVGLDTTLDPHNVYRKRRVCHAHFETKFLTWTRRLSFGAIPTLLLPGVPIPTTRTTAAAAAEVAPLPSTSAAAAADLQSASIISPPGPSVVAAGIDRPPSPTEPTPALDEELLLILGEDPSQIKSYGEHIQPDLAIRLQHIATTGLPKDIRKELTDKYLPPGNCTLIEPPTLNPEVVAAVSETIIKRDKDIELRQRQRTSTISCVAEALTLLMSSEPKNTALIKVLMDAIKLMCDSQNTDSTIRRSFILNCLKKELKDQLQATKIDKLLFSEDLAEILKAAKAISKTNS